MVGKNDAMYVTLNTEKEIVMVYECIQAQENYKIRYWKEWRVQESTGTVVWVKWLSLYL